VYRACCLIQQKGCPSPGLAVFGAADDLNWVQPVNLPVLAPAKVVPPLIP